MACHFWLSPPLQPHTCTLAPLVVLRPLTSTHLPSMPVICFWAAGPPWATPFPTKVIESMSNEWFDAVLKTRYNSVVPAGLVTSTAGVLWYVSQPPVLGTGTVAIRAPVGEPSRSSTVPPPEGEESRSETLSMPVKLTGE